MSNVQQRGVSLIEVLVAMVILAVGVLGLVVLQGRIQVLQTESYQRAQALVILNDMSARLSLNRINALEYVTAAPVGTGAACPGTSTTRAEADLAEWCESLRGAAELSGTDRVGAMVGGRGCVENLGNGQYLVTVAWQGLSPLSEPPPAEVTCGEDEYDGPAGHPCQGDLCRRVVTTVVRIPALS